LKSKLSKKPVKNLVGNGVISQKTEPFIIDAVKTRNLAYSERSFRQTLISLELVKPT
jgi:hypothetical protein